MFTNRTFISHSPYKQLHWEPWKEEEKSCTILPIYLFAILEKIQPSTLLMLNRQIIFGLHSPHSHSADILVFSNFSSCRNHKYHDDHVWVLSERKTNSCWQSVKLWLYGFSCCCCYFQICFQYRPRDLLKHAKNY